MSRETEGAGLVGGLVLEGANGEGVVYGKVHGAGVGPGYQNGHLLAVLGLEGLE